MYLDPFGSTLLHMDEDLSQALAATLRAEKGARQLTVEDIADATGLTQVSLHRWLNGKRQINTEVLEKLAAVFGLPPSRLMALAEERLARQHENGEGHEVVTFRKSDLRTSE